VGLSQLDLHSLDHPQRTAHELRQRGREIARALQAYGLRVGPGSAGAPPPEDPLLPGDGWRVAERQAVYHGRD
jgi:hypothetical protein